jgi:hypothetical protein
MNELLRKDGWGMVRIQRKRGRDGGGARNIGCDICPVERPS